MNNTNVITKSMCEELTQQVKMLRSKEEYYRRKLTNKKIAEETKIPLGSLGFYMANDSLPLNRYNTLKDYVDKVLRDY